MKKVLFTVLVISSVVCVSCGTSAYYASSEFEDGIYYRPSANERTESNMAMQEIDGLVERTKHEAARFNDTIVVSESISSVYLDYKPDTRYAIMLDGDSAEGVKQLDITFNFDDLYGYRNYNYWDYWYMVNNRPWMLHGYHPWYNYWGGPYYGWGYPWYDYSGPMFGIGFVWNPWFDWNWGGPWGYPWYDAWHHPWYGWYYHDILAESQRRQNAHNIATAKRVADIRANGGGRHLESSGGGKNAGISHSGRELAVSNIRGTHSALGEKYAIRKIGSERGTSSVVKTPSKSNFRRSAYVNANISADDVRNSYYNRINRNETYSGNNFSGFQHNSRATANSGRNTSSYGNARSSYQGSIKTSGTSVRSNGNGSSGSLRSSGGSSTRRR